MLPAILGLGKEELRALAQQEGQSLYRGNQISEWIYRRGVRTFGEMTNFTKSLRTQLDGKYEVGRSQVVTAQQSRDGTLKLLLEMRDGRRIETVGLPYEEHLSCCVSTQVGCTIGCVFCATGLSGYSRNLTAGEIVDQVLAVQEAMRNQQLLIGSTSTRLDHVTFMGMGEPLLNYAATMKAVQLLNTELGIGMRHMTLSTAGLVPGIYFLTQQKMQINLAVSLHAPTNDVRQQLVPGMTKWSVAEILRACREYVQHTGRRVTFEYVLLDGVNDRDIHAHELVSLLRGLNCHVNLIPYNPVGGLTFRSPQPKRVQAFREILIDAGIQVTQRFQCGADIDAACGQLRQRIT